MDLINRQDAIDLVKHHMKHNPMRSVEFIQGLQDAYLRVISDLSRQPSAITHCTRCQEWHPREATEYGFCVRFGQYTKQCDYCSYGK